MGLVYLIAWPGYYRTEWQFCYFSDSSIQLTASPSILSKSVTWATVSWSGVQDPSASDWIGLWVLPEKSSDDYSNIVKDHAPVKYQVHY